VLLEELPYAVRNVLLYFFLLFVFRVLLRNQWAAFIAFTAMFGLLSWLGNEDSQLLAAVTAVLYFGSGGFVVLRWGLLSFAVAHFISATLINAPMTFDTDAWYFGNIVLLIGIALALPAWALYTSLGGKLWNSDALT
jgi:hypothetical protein